MLSIIFVNYKSSSDINRCLKSIQDNDQYFADYEFIIVDNASDDKGLERLKRNFPNVRLVYAEKNGGFSYANNIGFNIASNDIIFMLNPDTYVDNNSIQLLYERLSNDAELDMIGPLLLYPDGRNQSYFHPKSYPTVWRIFCERFFFHRIFSKSKVFNSYFQTYMKYHSERYVEQICGAALMFKKTAIRKIGILDEHFFMYFEESDWCCRAVDKGLKLLYYPLAKIYHDEGLIQSDKSQHYAKIFSNSLLYYFRKNSHLSTLVSIIYVFGCCFRLITPNRSKQLYNWELIIAIIKGALEME